MRKRFASVTVLQLQGKKRCQPAIFSLFVTAMEKHPKHKHPRLFEVRSRSMNWRKLMSHISFLCVIVGCNSIALEADLDGELLYLMVDDFNEFSAIVTNPVDGLHLKKFVKTYSAATKTMGSCKLRPDDVNKGSLDQFIVSFSIGVKCFSFLHLIKIW